MSKKPIKKGNQKKAWTRRTTKSKRYRPNSKEKQKTFLIICEGKNTEPEYFKSIPVKTATVNAYGKGSSRTKLVKDVIAIIKTEKDKEQEVWVVFDMDIDVHSQNINQHKADYDHAIYLAQSHGINLAYSNDAFELWFLLHYQYFDNQWTRHQYYKRLSELWNCNYEKEAKRIGFSKTIYARLQKDERASEKQAMQRAKHLFDKQIELRYSEKNPCTKVYCLVDALNKYISKDRHLNICGALKIS